MDKFCGVIMSECLPACKKYFENLLYVFNSLIERTFKIRIAIKCREVEDLELIFISLLR